MATRTLVAAKPEISDLPPNCISHGFVGLLLEIIYRIVSAAPGAIIPCVNEAAMEKKYAERRESLSALCQVCRSLRAALLPLLWERLEACCLPDNQENQSNLDRWGLLVKKLAGQLEVISVTQPLYASYVRIVNIVIQPRVASQMLSNLAPALSLMPNLHTIQIVVDNPKSRGCNIFYLSSARIHDSFKGHLYPSVKRVILPAQATPILECFPEVREVCLNQPYPYHDEFIEFLENSAMSCKKLEKFGWIEFPDEEGSRAAAIAENLPKIRRLEYHMTQDFDVNEILQLSRLQNLEDFSLIIDAYVDLSQCSNAVLEVIEAAKKVLVASPNIINRRLTVMLRTETRSFTL